MPTHTRSVEAARRASKKNSELRRWYVGLRQSVFGVERWTRRKKGCYSHEDQLYRNARITLYTHRARLGLPLFGIAGMTEREILRLAGIA